MIRFGHNFKGGPDQITWPFVITIAAMGWLLSLAFFAHDAFLQSWTVPSESKLHFKTGTIFPAAPSIRPRDGWHRDRGAGPQLFFRPASGEVFALSCEPRRDSVSCLSDIGIDASALAHRTVRIGYHVVYAPYLMGVLMSLSVGDKSLMRYSDREAYLEKTPMHGLPPLSLHRWISYLLPAVILTALAIWLVWAKFKNPFGVGSDGARQD
jgi:hypothetical protein